MAIVNRALDSSQQELEFYSTYGAFSTGASNAPAVVPIAMIPYASNLVAARVSATGLSGAPTLDLSITRFIVGSGSTSYLGGFTTLTFVGIGTSGMQSVTIAAAGSTALSLFAGDVIYGSVAGQDSAISRMSVSIVVKATQSIKTHFGL